jgi:hypothetical protein
MVFFDGLDITKETQFLRGVPDLVRRGISVLVMNGPGTGEAIRFRGMPLRHDYEKARSACIDYLETRADVDAKRIGIIAISLGGYYAPRAVRRSSHVCRMHRLGRHLGLLRHLEETHRRWHQGLDVGIRPSHHLDPRG